MLVNSKKAFLFSSVWSGTEYTQALIWKKSLVICFESYQGPIPTQVEQTEECENFANG